VSCSWDPVGGRPGDGVGGARALRPRVTKEKSRRTRSSVLLGCGDEKGQLKHRCGAPLIKHILSEFRAGHLKAEVGCQELDLSRSRFYELYSDYLAAGFQRDQHWVPRSSGGNHAKLWPVEVRALLRERLSSRPPSSYSFAASEVLRKYQFKLDRAQVRRWALQNRLAPPSRVSPLPVAVRRWQRSRIGELWQLDASPHPFFPRSRKAFPMLNLIDDCSRLFTGSKLYHREVLLAYYDLLSEAFSAYGLPLILYVDFHSFFFTNTPEALTALGRALHFYGVTFRYAPTPQAKGKVERQHQFWQNRLPAYFAAENITMLEAANVHIRELRLHHNLQEVHREIKMTPQQAWDLALKQNRSALRPKPNCPWWPFVWSLRTSLRVSSQGYVPLDTQSVRLEAPPGSRVVLCHHPSGHHSILANHPKAQTHPVILFSDLPK
jgi:hypothetical protein